MLCYVMLYPLSRATVPGQSGHCFKVMRHRGPSTAWTHAVVERRVEKRWQQEKKLTRPLLG